MEIPFADAAKASIVRRGVIFIATEKDYSRKWRPIAPSNILRLRTCRPARDGTFSWRSRTLILLLLPGTARRGVISSQKQIIPASNAPTQSMAPQQYFTPVSVSPNTWWDLLMKTPYADSATTVHSLTGCNIATEADYPHKRRARLLEEYLPLCRWCPKHDGTLP